jgi:succinate dehydrogenase/fumarate reductase-like Fe-S protein
LNKDIARVQIYRQGTPGYQPEELQEYEVPFNPGWTVLDVLNYIYRELDGTLGYRFHCRSGVCVGCLIELNGNNILACKCLMEREMTIRPPQGKRCVRDLITDI